MKLLALLALVGCARPSYTCESASQCVRHGEQGLCANGSCAFADPACPAGYRYDTGACTPPLDAGIDAAGCGGFGLACCATDPACASGAACVAGTCQSCVDDVALGRRFACFLEGHDVWCSGENAKGQLGFGLAGVGSSTPLQVRDITSEMVKDATAIAAGREHACAVRAGGTVWCWGANESGELGTGAAFPMPPMMLPPQPAAVQVVKINGMPLTGMVAVAAGYNHTCALDGSGGVWCWGLNVADQLGDGTTTNRNAAAPVLTAPTTPFTGQTELQIGTDHTCTRDATSTAWCWGRDTSGELGDNMRTNHAAPLKIATTSSVAVGQYHVCYVNDDSTVSCAGAGYHARLGDATFGGFYPPDQLTFRQVLETPGGSPFQGATKVAAGALTCAILKDTTVVCWGDDLYGQTGTGGSELSPAPVLVADGTQLRHVDRIVAHYPHACAHLGTGEWLCWGRNSEGELGDGTFANRGVAAPLAGTCR